eukprot:2886225-Prymnesium_polylepis.1
MFGPARAYGAARAGVRRQAGAGGMQDRQLVRKRAGLVAEYGGLSEGNGGGEGGGVVVVERPRRGTRDAVDGGVVHLRQLGD